LENQQGLQDFGNLQKVALLHFFRIFLEAIFPILLALAAVFAKILDHTGQLSIACDLTQANMIGMRKWDHHSQTASRETQ